MINKTQFSKVTLLLSLILVILGTDAFGQASGIWTGDKDTFAKANSADWKKAANQDRITDSIWITRANNQGVFNFKVSSGYAQNVSPRGTKWSFGTTKNLSSLFFTDWENAVDQNPPGSVNKDMVMLVIKDSIYIDIKFTSWASGGGGGSGGFSYIRSSDCRSFDTITKAVCDSFVAPSKKVWRKSGVYYDTLTNRNSCDSIMRFNMTIYGQDTGRIFMSGCGSVIMPLSKKKVTTTGIHYDTLVKGTICGRDSILVANVFIYKLPTKEITVTACDTFVSPSGNRGWATSGTYSDVLAAQGTCDTALTVYLTINPSKVTQMSRTACDSFVSVTNKIYRQTGNYFDTLRTSLGCDSIIDLDLTINTAVNAAISPTVCSVSYVSPSGRNEWGVSGQYHDTIAASTGCDSILEINLTINPYTTPMTVSSCDPWTSPSQKHVYDQSGIYYDTLQVGGGCDSLLTIDFTKLQSTSSTVNVTAAINRYHSPSGKYTWTTNGTYMDTIPNQAGCDSVITFDHLTIVSFSLDVNRDKDVLTAVADGVNYQWLDCIDSYAPLLGKTAKTLTVTKDGSYAVEISNQWNSDTSECTAINLGIEDYQNLIRVYPNPNSGHFNIDFKGNHNQFKTVQVLNAIGVKVFTGNVNSENMGINLTDGVPAGLYIIRIEGKNSSFTSTLLLR